MSTDMNIKEVKEELKRVLQAQFHRDDKGGYKIPVENRRVILLAGPDGIGKKSILQQTAVECGAELVRCNMAHITAGMATGESRVEEKRYGGRKYTVLDYSMSEIVAAVYDTMEKTDNRQGVLFVEDIHLASEELVPLVWQLIQEKKMGKYHIPREYSIVLSMSVPAVHPSIREFPVEVSGKILRLDIKPDFAVWKEYADKEVIHPAILSYLEQYPEHLFSMDIEESAIDFVTPAGWEDLSSMLYAYESLGHKVTVKLVLSYLRKENIAEAFTEYLEDFRQIPAIYRVPEILAGSIFKRSAKKLQKASDSGRALLAGWIRGYLRKVLREWYRCQRVAEEVLPLFEEWKSRLADSDVWNDTSFTKLLADYEERKQERLSAGGADKDAAVCMDMVSEFLQEESMNVFSAMTSDDEASYEIVMQDFALYQKGVEKQAAQIEKSIENAGRFLFGVLEQEALRNAFEEEIYQGFYGGYYRAWAKDCR